MDDDDLIEVDADYGVFGDPGGLVPRALFPVYSMSTRDERARKYYQLKRRAEAEVSSAFNRAMIDLYNSRSK